MSIQVLCGMHVSVTLGNILCTGIGYSQVYVICVVYVTMLPDSMRCTTAGLENRIMYSLSDLLQKIAAGGGIQVPD